MTRWLVGQWRMRDCVRVAAFVWTETLVNILFLLAMILGCRDGIGAVFKDIHTLELTLLKSLAITDDWGRVPDERLPRLARTDRGPRSTSSTALSRDS
ncbi:hypothetical protein BJ741DRAFT_589903 [Chytriomyces cf. hyalinus JEL632]|nr:hypothetical protein BJ741DRAFT_589903 [Chytriomyces cf. hyalinus JEL632]